MIYREIRPHFLLSEYVRCFWVLEREYHGSESEVVWPDGNVELLFHFGDRYVDPMDKENRKISHSFIIGPLTRYFHLKSTGKVRLIGVRFYSWGFLPFFRIPMHLLKDRVVPLVDVIGNDANQLEETLFEADVEQSVDILQKYLLKIYHRSLREPDPMIVSFAKSILIQPGNIKLSEFEHLSGLSARQLERKFNEYVGVTPKKMSVICRFDAARKYLLHHPDADLMDRTFRYGYYDYSHFAKDFKKFIGMTPHDFKNWIIKMAAQRDNEDVVFLQDEPGE